MSQDHLTALRLLSYYWLTIIMPPNILTFNVAYNKEPSSSSSSSSFQLSAFHHGSRKFGGYRIVPRSCKDASVDTSYKNDAETGSGVCMFNYECTQLGGTVVGSCVDVFLFGACCRLPAGAKVPTVEQSGAATASTAATTTGRQPPGWSFSEQPPLSFQQPVADTILFHRNGSAVQNTYSPDDMSADLFANLSAALMQANRRPPMDMTDVITEQQYTTSSADGQHHHRPPFGGSKITSKVDYGDSGAPTTVKHPSPWSSSSSSWPSSSPVSKSTDSVPNIRKTTPSGTTVQATTSKQGYGGYVHAAPPDDYYDNMVLVPTLTVQNDPNVKTPVENNSIHHILSILNHTPPTDADQHDVLHDRYQDQERDPMDTSPSYQHTSSATLSQSSSPALYTWGSIEGDSKLPGYAGSSTFPATKPSTVHHSSPYYTQQTSTTSPGYYGSTSTSTHHLPGPHFHVLSTTSKPSALDPAVPTVIVLSSANDSKYPNKFSTSSLSSHRPTPSSHVKPSQSIVVTGKPSVSAAYTTTATYHHPAQHHHQYQEQQNVAFVPVSSTTLADHYYNTNHHGVVHTSAKPLLSTYSSRPTSTTTVSPTLSSTVHHDNNVFTTVITSVNQQYHNKYQPTSTFTTAKPVLNDAGTAAILSPSGGYKPTASAADDDYPLPVVTPATQVFITASDLHHHHHHLQHHTSSSSYPSTSSSAVAAAADDEAAALPFNATDTFAFPPVRDPNVNLTAATQQEKPYVVPGSSGGIGGGGGSGVGGGDDYDTDADPNPQLTADDNLDDKVHLFVEKVVQSLQGNFEDLEKVLLSGDASSSNVSIGTFDDPAPTATGWPNKKPTASPATTTKKPYKPTAGKPTKPPPNKVTATSTYKPTPITIPQDVLPYLELTSTTRPTKVPTLLTPVQLFQPTTYATDNKRPTKQPVKVTQATTIVLDTLNVEHDHPTTTAEPDYRKTCGVRPLVRKNGRIVGGTGSTFGEWPWQVLVREATWLGLFTKNKCGGVLITQRHVITAAHCQPGFLANLVAVFGEYDISGEVESKRSISKNVKRVIVHRQYDAATFENDIALLELESPVSYDLHIVPICMPDDDDEFTGRMAVVTGWGRLKYGGGVPSILQEVQVPIIENQVCQDMFETAGHSKTILNSFLCAGYANGQRDSCEGDSGGPLMIEKDNGRWTLIGTVSHGIKCAAPYLPGVYMRTTYYKPWLQTITGVQ